MIHPVLVAYTKPIRNRITRNQFEVAGNALLQIDERTVAQFDIPIAHNFSSFLVEREVRGYGYDRWYGQTVQVPEHTRLNSGTASTYNIARIRRYHRTGWSGRSYDEGSWAIRFPYFFNVWMIRRAVASMISTPKDNLELTIDSRRKERSIFMKSQGMDERWGTAKVVQQLGSTRNIDRVGWGELTVVQPIVPKPRQRLTKINKASS